MNQEPAINSELSVQELSHIHGVYDKLKFSAFASTGLPVSSVQLIHKDLVPQLHRTMVDYYEWQQRKVGNPSCTHLLLMHSCLLRAM